MALIYEKKGKIAHITINRPETLNSIDPETLQELGQSFQDFRDDPDLWVAIVTGAGNRAFSVGADISKMLPFMKDQCCGAPWRMANTIMRGLKIWKPIIAAVNGHALGGGLELAMACDLRIAAENATFGQPEVRLGLIPGWGGTQRLPRLIPKAKAAEMLLMAQNIDASEAYRIGLVNKVVPLPDLIPTATEWAENICKLGPLAVRATKQAMIEGESLTLEDGLSLEWMLEEAVLSTEDFEEGTKAFLEKKPASFKAK